MTLDINSPTDRVINALHAMGNTVKMGNGTTYDYIAQCPAHDDTTPSLAITGASDGKALLCCHAGCPTDEVIRALGLEEKDLFPDDTRSNPTYCRHSSSTGKADKPFWFDESIYHIVSTHDYVDEDGSLLFQTLRLEDDSGNKTYRQRRPDGSGGWIGNLSNTRRVLYNLPAVLDAVKNNKPIYLVEGEKCADRLIKEGLPATTNPMGASKWSKNYTDTLKDAIVYFFPDNDIAGHKHAERVKNELSAHVRELKIINLPDIQSLGEKADVYDWLAAGHTMNELRTVIDKTDSEPIAPQKPKSRLSQAVSAKDLAEMEFPPVEWLVDGFLPHGLILLAGRGKIGKSWMVLDFALSIASGSPVLGHYPTNKCGVIYLALEDGHMRLNDRIKTLSNRKAIPDNLLIFSQNNGWRRLDEGGVDDLRDCLMERPDIRLIVIDTLQKVKPNPRSHRNAYENDYDAMKDIHKLATEYGVSIILIHHTRKAANSEDVFDGVSGSIGTTATADTNAILKKERIDNRATLILTSRDTGEKEIPLLFNPDTCKWTVADEPSGTTCKSPERQEIYNVLAAAEQPLDAKAVESELLRKGIKKNSGTIRYHLSKMCEDGEILRPETGKYATPHNITNKQTLPTTLGLQEDIHVNIKSCCKGSDQHTNSANTINDLKSESVSSVCVFGYESIPAANTCSDVTSCITTTTTMPPKDDSHLIITCLADLERIAERNRPRDDAS